MNIDELLDLLDETMEEAPSLPLTGGKKMVDVDRRMSGLNPAHIAGLRRLSARAASSTPSTPIPSRNLTSLAHNLITHLQTSGITVHPGFSDANFARAKAEFEFTFYFPLDLRAVHQAGLPLAPGFLDWRSPLHL